MSDALRSKFHQWLVIFVVVPAVVLVVVCNVFLLRLLQRSHNESLDSRAILASAQVEQALHGESVRLLTLSGLPGAAALAASAERREAVQSQDDFTLEELWTKADRDDLIIRGILDNDVASAFNRALEQNAEIRSLILTDSRGRLLAATERVRQYMQKGQSWWTQARTAAPGHVMSDGINADGRMSLACTVIRPGRSNLVDGVVQAEIDVPTLLAGSVPASADGDVVVFILGASALQVSGQQDLFARASARLTAKILDEAGDAGWTAGFRYHAQALGGGVGWGQPVRLVAAVSESAVPLAVFLPMFASIALCALAVFGVFFLALNLGHRLFFDPLREAAEAGVWVLRTAYGQASREQSALQQSWAQNATEETSLIQQDLARWLNSWRQELQSQSSSMTVDMKRDLELATEFQQAFLNRPYPRVPEIHLEGRLRLEFYHRYRPALAMGGDFFDLQAIGPDCAGIFVADVMGHGTRSALIVSILRTLIAELSRRGRNAPHFIRELNAEFCQMLKTLPHPFFASAAYFVCDTTARMATYAFAGHPPPFYLHRSVGRVTRLEMPKPQGAALGLVPNEEYGGESVRLLAGDAFVFFTDGVYEAANRKGEEFGLQRLEKHLRANVYKTSKEILDSVMEAITQFVGDQQVADDICLVAVDVTTEAEAKSR